MRKPLCHSFMYLFPSFSNNMQHFFNCTRRKRVIMVVLCHAYTHCFTKFIYHQFSYNIITSISIQVFSLRCTHGNITKLFSLMLMNDVWCLHFPEMLRYLIIIPHMTFSAICYAMHHHQHRFCLYSFIWGWGRVYNSQLT